MNDHESEGPCFMTIEDDPMMLATSTDSPLGPAWWEGCWPAGGIDSAEGLARWVDERLEQVISLHRYYPKTLGAITFDLGKQTIENATRYLARFGDGDHPARPKEEELRDFADIQNALEAILRQLGGRDKSNRIAESLENDFGAEGPDARVPGPTSFIIDPGTFSASWDRKTCHLGHTKPFKLLVRLGRRPGHYASVNSLIDDVWPDAEPEVNTVQKTIGQLRKKLGNAGMGDLIAVQPKYYALMLPPGVSVYIPETFS